MAREQRQSDWDPADVGGWERHLRQPANACDASQCQSSRIIPTATRTARGWIAFVGSERGRRWNAEQIIRSKKLVQPSKIFFPPLQCLRDASAIELVCQFETGSYVGTKFRLGVSDPRTEATLDLRPLNHAEVLDCWRMRIAPRWITTTGIPSCNVDDVFNCKTQSIQRSGSSGGHIKSRHESIALSNSNRGSIHAERSRIY